MRALAYTLSFVTVACASDSARRNPDWAALPPQTATPDPPAPVASAPPGPGGSFACGDQLCRLGAESCCQNHDRAVCAPNAEPKPTDATQLLGSQIELCAAAPHAVEVNQIARCRSSQHCSTQELCCNEFLFGGAIAVVCKAAACEYGEACSPDAPCRDAATVCVKAKCQRQAEIDCGKKRCNLTTHTCVVTDPRAKKLECVPDAQVSAWRSEGRPISDVSCAKHADCQTGELCRSAVGRAFCQHADDGMTAVMCDTVSDCPKDMCKIALPGKTQLACVRDPDEWHALCNCR